MTRGPLVQVVLHRDEERSAEDLSMFAKAMAKGHIYTWDFVVTELNTSEGAETAVVTIQFKGAPRRLLKESS